MSCCGHGRVPPQRTGRLHGYRGGSHPLGQWLGKGLWWQDRRCALTVTLFYIAIRLYDEERAVRVEGCAALPLRRADDPMALSTLVVLKGMEHGRYLVLLPVICAFLTDGGAYFAGVFLGKHRGITKVSPNKSLEGYIGGILSGVLFLLLYGGDFAPVRGAGGLAAGDGGVWPAGQHGN